MKVSVSWLKDLVEFNNDIDELSEKLSMTGFEVESLEDLSEQAVFDHHAQSLETADLIFCDAPKDGKFEYKFLNYLSQYPFNERSRYLVLDDIRFLNMAPLWRQIDSPKLDLTSFGHWSGTGIVDISKGLLFKKA